jgi:hypothetical protein
MLLIVIAAAAVGGALHETARRHPRDVSRERPAEARKGENCAHW